MPQAGIILGKFFVVERNSTIFSATTSPVMVQRKPEELEKNTVFLNKEIHYNVEDDTSKAHDPEGFSLSFGIVAEDEKSNDGKRSNNQMEKFMVVAKKVKGGEMEGVIES